MKRPSYKFSVWLWTGRHDQRLVSTFTREEAEAWEAHLRTVYTDADQVLEVRDYGY